MVLWTPKWKCGKVYRTMSITTRLFHEEILNMFEEWGDFDHVVQ